MEPVGVQVRLRFGVLLHFGAMVRTCMTLGAALVVVACDGPPPEPSEPPADRAQERAHPEPSADAVSPAPAPPAPEADAAPNRSSMAVELQAVRRDGAVVEIEVALDRPLPPLGSVRPSLQVGDEITQRSRAGADGRLDRLVFLLDAEQLERMPADGELMIRAGVLSNETAQTRPRLSDVEVTIVGGAP